MLLQDVASTPLARWLEKIETGHPKAIDFGLARISRVKDALGIAFDCPVITVGGTNGKGSTCAFLESILLNAGYRVGVHTSPHLMRFNERARINGIEAGDDELVAEFEAVEAARIALDPPVSLTYFEFSLLAILRLFQRAKLDAVVLEVGLGGRLDGVNSVDSDCAIVTSIDIDHREYLGDTRELIALEKAHIYRPNKPAICADPRPPETLIDYAKQIGADLRLLGRDFNYAGQKNGERWQQWSWAGRSTRRSGLAYPALRGANQLLNASAALAALEALADRLPITMQAVRLGLANVDLPGRFQTLPGQPAVVFDVAHNPHAAAALANNLDNMAYFPSTRAVFGCMRDKDIAGIVRALGDRVDVWHLADLPGPRGARADEIEALLTEQGLGERKGRAFFKHATPAEAFDAAKAQVEAADRIVVFGSFVTVGSVMQTFEPQRLRR